VWVATPSPYDSFIRYTSPLIPALPPIPLHSTARDSLTPRLTGDDQFGKQIGRFKGDG
jgi:hypothetical protein